MVSFFNYSWFFKAASTFLHEHFYRYLKKQAWCATKGTLQVSVTDTSTSASWSASVCPSTLVISISVSNRYIMWVANLSELSSWWAPKEHPSQLNQACEAPKSVEDEGMLKEFGRPDFCQDPKQPACLIVGVCLFVDYTFSSDRILLYGRGPFCENRP